MSLWAQSLSYCLYDCGDDQLAIALCILDHLSMPVPRSWWELALQTGKIPDGYVDMLNELRGELIKASELSGYVDIPVLIALAFVDDDINEQKTKVGDNRESPTIQDYLASARKVLIDRPEIQRLGEAIAFKA